jgi:hypothetical protein
VPWNNNNAENAIKRFAYSREDTAGLMKESGLSDYLLLLSIRHTCRYKGVSFLKFLLSREWDVDAFCEGMPRKQHTATIETYPPGFVPPHFARWKTPKQSDDSRNAQEHSGRGDAEAERSNTPGEQTDQESG